MTHPEDRHEKILQPPSCPTEVSLRMLGIDYRMRGDGIFIVEGDIRLSNRGLKSLPDFSRAVVKGGFYCNNNDLQNLRGAPMEVQGDFLCQGNTDMTSLAGAPEKTGGKFWAGGCNLLSLEGAPRDVGDDFLCNGNKGLRSLVGGPGKVGGQYNCADNAALETLEGAAQSFLLLTSPFGTFDGAAAIPESLRWSQQSLQRMAEEEAAAAREKTEAFRRTVRNATAVADDTVIAASIPKLRPPQKKTAP